MKVIRSNNAENYAKIKTDAIIAQLGDKPLWYKARIYARQLAEAQRMAATEGLGTYNFNYSALGGGHNHRWDNEYNLSGAPDVKAVAQSRTDAIIEAIGKIVPLYQQNRIFNAQLKLAQQQAAQGSGVLDTSNLIPAGIPVSMGVDKQTQFIIMGGIALLAVILLLKKH